jgi:subtilase family serine protease
MPRHPRRLRPSLSFRAGFVEFLEDRALLSTLRAAHIAPLATRPHLVSTALSHVTRLHPSAAHAAPAPFATPELTRAQLITPNKGGGGGTGSPPASALTPAQTRHIYAFDQIANLGQGQKIAIVDAYDDPNIFGDADVFDRQFMTTLGGSTSYYTQYGASTTWLTKAYASGSRPPGSVGWGQEISLDVEWAHAIAPQAQILLVEARSNSFADLLAADDYAVAHGATVISNSWGGGESSGETSYDSHFTAQGVTFVFSAGDSGNQSYPAESPDVVSVGGTSLTHDASYNWTGETGWSSGGGGVSGFEVKPSYQSALSYANRANPDIAYNADPNTGVAVYDSYGANFFNPAWGQYGGTSAGAPQWSALIALANQGRVGASKGVLDGVSQTLPALYAMPTGTATGSTLYDVTSGGNGVGSAGPGYDLVTGLGTPRQANLVFQALVNY